MKIDEASNVVSAYLSKKLSKDYRIVRVKKEGNGWLVVAEVFEDSAFIKSLGLNTNAKDKFYYAFHLDEAMEIVEYERMSNESID